MLFKRFFLLFILLTFPSIALSSNDFADINPFLGKFEGEAISADDEKGTRFLSVHIWKTDEGSFHLDWETIAKKEDGREKITSHSVEFKPSNREGIYGSAMRKNLFGKWEPLNPLMGDPYLWAKVKDDVFIVYAMMITEDGGYEMQQYNRKMIDDQTMELVFYRIKDGKPLVNIEGFLRRIR